MKRLGVMLMIIVLTNHVSAQDNFTGISLQGQLTNRSGGETGMECMILSDENDTLWRANHESVSVGNSGMFSLNIGQGLYIDGIYDTFSSIDWTNAVRFELYEVAGDRNLIGVYGISALPYAFHSRYISDTPSVSDLVDTPSDEAFDNAVIRYNGITYFWSEDSLYNDPFAEMSDSVHFADTVWFAFNDSYADSASFALSVDSILYAWELITVMNSDTSAIPDSAGVGLFSLGNWGLNGNYGVVDSNYVGTVSEDTLILITNNAPRIIFADSSFNNNVAEPGFHWNTKKGFLVSPNDLSGPTEFSDAFVYFNGERSLFHAGRSDLSIDTLMGNYSFAFGENVGTNGPYSAVFGKNTYGDTAIFGASTPYAAISSFAVGRNCHVTHMGMAIGDSAVAGYYRNIAIGHKAIATSASAGVALGDNVLVTGATSWAAGHNLTADGNFSTALGQNASTAGLTGTFVYGDASTSDTVYNTATHQFMVRASGGYVFYSSVDLSMGVELLPGAGSWTMISDRSKKMNIIPLKPIQFKPIFDSLNVYSWNYIGNETGHVGPIAQDIYSLFNVGEKPYLINMIDSDGITFLGIQMLRESINELELLKEDSLNTEFENEQESLDELEQRINALYEELDNN